jgi:hypothetical protein
VIGGQKMVGCITAAKASVGILNAGALVCSLVGFGGFWVVPKGEVWAKNTGNGQPEKLLLAVFIFAVISFFFGFLFACCMEPVALLYWAAVTIVLVLSFALIVWTSVYNLQTLKSIDKHWNDLSYNQTKFEIERAFGCCGFGAPDRLSSCGASPNARNVTCKDWLSKEIARYQKEVGIDVGILAACQIILLICAIAVYRHFDSSEDHVVPRYHGGYGDAIYYGDSTYDPDPTPHQDPTPPEDPTPARHSTRERDPPSDERPWSYYHPTLYTDLNGPEHPTSDEHSTPNEDGATYGGCTVY